MDVGWSNFRNFVMGASNAITFKMMVSLQRGRTKDINLAMAVWLFILPWLIRAICASGVLGSAIEAALSRDVLLIAFARLGFADFYQASYALKSFRELVDPIVRFRCGIKHNGKTFLNYTAIIREMDALMQDAGKSGSLCKDSRALEGSFHFNCIKSILEARFGYCIEYAAGRLPKFTFSHLSFDILLDEHRIVALPYILDQDAHDLQWVYLIQGLVKLGRLDLLNRLTFPKVSNSNFEQLANNALPDALMLNVVKSLQGNYPITKLAKVLAWIHSGFPANPVPENCKVSLVFLQYMHERNMAIPRGWVLYCELEQASISFWLYLIQREAEEARALLDLVRRQGSGDTKYLAGVFYGAVQTENLCVSGIDFYQAMLIRFHSSPVCNEHIIRNYETMLDELSTIGYHTACALLDCERYELMEKYPFDNKHDFSLKVIIDRIYRLGHGSLDSLLQKDLEYSPAASSLLKRLLQTKADDAYARLVWQSLQSIPAANSG